MYVKDLALWYSQLSIYHINWSVRNAA